MIAVYFYHKTTRAPWTGLSPTVSGINLDTNKVVLSGATMQETSLAGWYTCPFDLDTNINYGFNYVPNNTDYIHNVEKAFIPANQKIGWGAGISTSYLSEAVNEIKRLIDSKNVDLSPLKKAIDKLELNIEIAKDEIITKIPTVDLTPTNTSIGTLKAQFTKLSDWIKKKDDKEKSEELTEKEDEYSQILEDIESEFKTLLSSKDQEIEALKKELEEEKTKEDKYEAMVQVLEEEIQETKEKVEKETKDNILKTLETL